jgi:hypothetical protein
VSVYPTLYAGQRMTAALLQALVPDIKYKSAQTTRASTTTVTDDPDLTTTLEANAVYDVWMLLMAGTAGPASGGTNAGLQTKWTVPSGASGTRQVVGLGSTQTQTNADNVSARLGAHGFATAVNYGTRNSDNSLFFTVWERATVFTTSSGTLALGWAQVVSNATATIVAAGSSMHVKRVA